jgi:tetratricopeptide (TPR) repeat protein
LVMTDELLEIVIMQNIESWDGQDVYHDLLFDKAASLYQLDEFAKAEHVLRELLKLAPWDRKALRFLQKCLIRQRPTWLFKAGVIGVLLVLLSACTIALEIFVINPFYPNLSEWFEYLHKGVLVSGILTLGIGEAWHSLRCRNTVMSFIERWRKRKSYNG